MEHTTLSKMVTTAAHIAPRPEEDGPCVQPGCSGRFHWRNCGQPSTLPFGLLTGWDYGREDTGVPEHDCRTQYHVNHGMIR